MKKILFGIILFSAMSVTSYAQEAKKVVKSDADKPTTEVKTPKSNAGARTASKVGQKAQVTKKNTDSPDVAAFKAEEAAKNAKNIKPKTKGE